MSALCDLEWTIAKFEPAPEEAPEQDTLILVQPADDTTAAISLVIVGRENILRLRDFIDEVINKEPPTFGATEGAEDAAK